MHIVNAVARVILLVAVTLVFSEGVSAQALDPSRQLIISVRPGAKWTPTQLIGYVTAGTTSQYKNQIGEPSSAVLVSLGNVSSHVTQNLKDEYSEAKTYLLLTYSGTAKRDTGATRASNYVHITGIQKNEASFFAVQPDDQLLYNPDIFGFPNTDYAWQYEAMGFWSAWSYGRGYLRVGVADAAPDTSHPELQKAISTSSSFDFREDEDVLTYNPDIGVHGTMVAGLVAARSNNPGVGGTNGQGIAGACPTCTLNIAAAAFADERMNALEYLAVGGASVVNLSGYASNGSHGTSREPIDPTNIPCRQLNDGGAEHVWCHGIRLMSRRDVLFVAAAGNYKSRSYLETGEPASSGHFGVHWPARDPMAVAVGGSDLGGARWDEANYPADVWDNQTSSCPIAYPGNANSAVFIECGSNWGNALSFLAPAREVVSTVTPGATYFPTSSQWCSDAAFQGANDGFGRCNGTSFAAPLFAGAAALLRSINPLVSSSEIVQALRDSSGAAFDPSRGWGIPHVGSASVRLRGKVNGSTLVNRLTPLFSLANDVDKDYIYTSSPQVAVAAFVGDLYTQPTPTDAGAGVDRPYLSSQGFYLPGRRYTLPDTIDPNGDVWMYGPYAGNLTPRSNILVFTGENSPYPDVSLVPLHRLAFRQACDRRNTAYATADTGAGSVRYFLGGEASPPLSFCSPSSNAAYSYEGLEGFLMATCPAAFGSCTDYSDLSKPQPIYLRYSATEMRWALIPGYLLSASKFGSYTASVGSNSGRLGYAFVNHDGDWDGVADGFERLVGLNHRNVDSDCDSELDGNEFPQGQLQDVSGDPIGTPGCGPQPVTTVNTSLSSTPSPGVQRLAISAEVVNPANGQSIVDAYVLIKLLNAANVSGAGCTLVPLPPVGGLPYAPRLVACPLGNINAGQTRNASFTVDVATDPASDEITARYASGYVQSGN